MQAVIDKGMEIIQRERIISKRLQGLLATTMQVMDQEKLLADKKACLQTSTDDTIKAFLSFPTFHVPSVDVHKNNAIRDQCASLANSIDKNLAEHMKTYSNHHYNLHEAFQYGTTSSSPSSST